MTFFQADTLRVDQLSGGVACLWLDVPAKGQNVLGRALVADLFAALERVTETNDVRVLVIRSAKAAGFLAGADLTEFAGIQSPADAEATSARGQELFDKLAALRVPSVAVVHGPCLGGGLELALACDYRLVVDTPATQLGLPEIELGLLPAWGGTQRLPRIVGLERALQVILGGKRLSATEAFRWRLADGLAPPGDGVDAELGRLIQKALTAGKAARLGLPLHNWRQWLLEGNGLGRWLLYRGTDQLLARRVPDDMPAPREALRAVQVGVRQGTEAGLIQEREAAGRLVTSPACRGLVNLFFQREKARRLPDTVRKLASEKIRRVGIIGLGTMGAGIAQLAALRGYEIVVREANAEALGAGILRLQGLVQKAVDRRLLTAADAEKKLKAVQGTLGWDGFDSADLVVEAAVENLDAKRAIFRDLDRVARPDAVLTSNTSALSIAALQEGLNHPRRVAGCHFFNPVHKLPLVEVVRGPQTDERALDLVRSWAVALGKTPVVVVDSPGFVVNRVLAPYLNEAIMLVAEGMDVREVDRVMRRFGMPVGPLEMLDQVGLDVASHVVEALRPVFADRLPPNPALEKMRDQGWLGVKNGWGFYRYAGKSPRVNEAAVVLLRDARLPGVSPVRPDDPEIARDRMVLASVNEAAAVLAEGLAADAEAVDLAMVMGAVWAPHRGGPLRYAHDRGWPAVVQRLTDLAQRFGPRFDPRPSSKQEKASGAY